MNGESLHVSCCQFRVICGNTDDSSAKKKERIKTKGIQTAQQNIVNCYDLKYFITYSFTKLYTTVRLKIHPEKKNKEDRILPISKLNSERDESISYFMGEINSSKPFYKQICCITDFNVGWWRSWQTIKKLFFVYVENRDEINCFV